MVESVPGVPRLTNLCIQQAKTRFLATELLLCLPQEVLGELCRTPASKKNSSCIVLINDTPLQADANIVSGVICGFHVFRREFLFGEYETNVFQDSLESATWETSVPLKDIVPVIGDFYETAQENLNKTNCNPNPKHLTAQNGKGIEALLYQQVSRWVLKHNCYFSLKISDEFLKLAQKETMKVRMVIY